MEKPKRILICPLDWGLGHATRCIPIIQLLLKRNVNVFIAASGRSLALLKKEFPDLTFIDFAGYTINYPTSTGMIFKVLSSLPKIFRGIKQEHDQLEKIIDKYKIDIVISDNRYGCWNKKVKSIFITHQLMIKSPFGEQSLHHLILKYVGKYHECWIPDNSHSNNLSGDLAHKYPLPKNTFFIGALSRFENNSSIPSKISFDYDVMAIISGPEPQRTIFEKKITEQFSTSKLKGLIISGKPDNDYSQEKGTTTIVSHLNSLEMKTAILNSEIIISRSGYSTIMDLAVLNKKAVFIPTPGQTEQEYLANFFMKKNSAYSQKQSEFNLMEALKESKKYSGFKNDLNSTNVLEQRIDSMLSSM